MFRYECPKCHSSSFSASENKADEPCAHCGHSHTELIGVADGSTKKAPLETAISERGANEINQLQNSTQGG